MSAVVYVLEDDPDIRVLYQRELTAAGFDVSAFGVIADFNHAFGAQRCDLCILDLSLPDGDALVTLRQLMADDALPTIIVSGRGSVGDKVLGLDFGADDYMVKPVDMLELIARMNRLLRRQEMISAALSQAPSQCFSFAGWTVDFSTLKLTAPDGAEQNLSAADMNLLKAFVESPGKILTRDRLLEVCQLETQDIFDRSIDLRVSRLRKKLQDDPRNPQFIKTVYGAGYLFAPVVSAQR